jgi:hypothetical protein
MTASRFAIRIHAFPPENSFVYCSALNGMRFRIPLPAGILKTGWDQRQGATRQKSALTGLRRKIDRN